jgi:alanyl-tRNA synthetase
MTAEELQKVEDIVNEKIAAALPVVTKEMSMEEAKKTGAMALFGEKYGDTVRVVSMGDFSIELCGGTHVSNTSHVGIFKIVSESGVAAGVRRIEALTGSNARAYYKNAENELIEAAKLLKTTPADLADHIKKLQEELKAVKSENESLKSKEAQAALGDVTDKAQAVKAVKLIAASVKGVDMNGLRDLGDQLKTKLGDGVVVLISENDGKVNLMAMATDGAIAKGAHAGNLVKEIAALVGGGGGGRPNMAQAGGKNPAGIPDAIAKVAAALEGQIK